MMAVKQVQMGTLMRDVLGENFVSLELRGVDHAENLVAGRYSLAATLVDVRTGVERSVQGKGEGLVDVAFNALIRTLLSEYPSLASLRFQSFRLVDDHETDQRSLKGDPQMTAHLAVENQVGHTFRFTASSRSATKVCLRVTLMAAEYFINSEQAFYRVRGFLDDARDKNRPDLVDRYTVMLTSLVMNSLYAGSTEN